MISTIYAIDSCFTVCQHRLILGGISKASLMVSRTGLLCLVFFPEESTMSTTGHRGLLLLTTDTGTLHLVVKLQYMQWLGSIVYLVQVSKH